MPYKSEAQRKFFNSEAGKEKIGEAEVEHWNKESEGMKLPEKVKDTLDKAIKACDDRLSVDLEEMKRNISMTKNYADEISRMKNEIGKLDSQFNELRAKIIKENPPTEKVIGQLKSLVSERNKIKR